MANTIDRVDYYRNKIEAELDKPEAQQNPAKLAFWSKRLEKLEAQPQGKQFHSIELSSKLYFSS